MMFGSLFSHRCREPIDFNAGDKVRGDRSHHEKARRLDGHDAHQKSHQHAGAGNECGLKEVAMRYGPLFNEP